MTSFAPWYPATRCTGSARQGARALMRYALDTYDRAKNWGIYNCRNTRSGGSFSPHAEGRAIDVGFPLASDGTGSSYGYALVNALLEAGPEKLGIQAIIYDRKIWSAKSPDGRPWEGASPHYDHVHVEMTRAAANSVTLATVRSVLAGTATSGSRYERFTKADLGERVLGRFKSRPWSAGTDVARLQEALNSWYPKLSKLKVDGYFGRRTEDRVEYLQRKAGLKVDGIVGPRTWAVISRQPDPVKPLTGKTVDYSNLRMAAVNEWKDGGDSSVENVQRALNYEFRGQDLKVDGIFGPRTRTRYSQWQKREGFRGADADGIPGRTTLDALGAKYGFRVTS